MCLFSAYHSVFGNPGKRKESPDEGEGGDDKKFKSGAAGSKVKTANGFILFGQGNNGPKFSVGKCMELVKTVFPGANRGNFCLEAFLSKVNKCSNGKHSVNHSTHKFSAEVLALREQMECKPYRVDSKAKPSK